MFRLLMILVVLLGALAGWALLTTEGQDFLLPRLLERAFPEPPSPPPDRLDVFVCGAGSPLRPPDVAQACIAVRAGQRVFIVDGGAGSALVFQQSGWDLARLERVFLTHFHSDHIAAIPDFNLNSWVAGRTAPLMVTGPEGVERVVAGFNEAYALDRGYRVAHHGEALLRPPLGELQAVRFDSGALDLGGDLQVTSAIVNHDPIRPAVAYRFDYRGRSVVVSGDTVVTESLITLAKGADVLLHDALSLPLINGMAARMGETGRDRLQKILLDVTDYHAPASQLGAVVEQTGVQRLIVYHLVPTPPVRLLEPFFTRVLPAGTLLAVDGMRVELPLGSQAVHVRRP